MRLLYTQIFLLFRLIWLWSMGKYFWSLLADHASNYFFFVINSFIIINFFFSVAVRLDSMIQCSNLFNCKSMKRSKWKMKIKRTSTRHRILLPPINEAACLVSNKQPKCNNNCSVRRNWRLKLLPYWIIHGVR